MKEKCPLTGKFCNKAKTIHITDIKDNKETSSVSLCLDCAIAYMNKDKSIVAPEKFLKDVFELFNTFIQAVESCKNHPCAHDSKSLCPNCGTTLKEISSGGRLGCPECYDYFQLGGLLQNIHGGAKKHVGKTPSQWKNKQKNALKEKKRNIPIELRIKGLELKMDSMINQEKYESAACIKKTIVEMEKLQLEINSLRAAMQTADQQEDKSHMDNIKSQIDAIMDKCAEIELLALRSMK